MHEGYGRAFAYVCVIAILAMFGFGLGQEVWRERMFASDGVVLLLLAAGALVFAVELLSSPRGGEGARFGSQSGEPGVGNARGRLSLPLTYLVAALAFSAVLAGVATRVRAPEKAEAGQGADEKPAVPAELEPGEPKPVAPATAPGALR